MGVGGELPARWKGFSEKEQGVWEGFIDLAFDRMRVVTTDWRCPTCRLRAYPDVMLDLHSLKWDDLEETDECTTCASQRRDGGRAHAEPEAGPKEGEDDE